MSVELVFCAKTAREAALARETEWMKQALTLPRLNERRFQALISLIRLWPDEQVAALAGALHPDQRLKGRAEALRAIAATHSRQTRLILELDAAIAALG
jgi:hypothetical protein